MHQDSIQTFVSLAITCSYNRMVPAAVLRLSEFLKKSCHPLLQLETPPKLLRLWLKFRGNSACWFQHAKLLASQEFGYFSIWTRVALSQNGLFQGLETTNWPWHLCVLWNMVVEVKDAHFCLVCCVFRCDRPQWEVALPVLWKKQFFCPCRCFCIQAEMFWVLSCECFGENNTGKVQVICFYHPASPPAGVIDDLFGLISSCDGSELLFPGDMNINWLNNALFPHSLTQIPKIQKSHTVRYYLNKQTTALWIQWCFSSWLLWPALSSMQPWRIALKTTFLNKRFVCFVLQWYRVQHDNSTAKDLFRKT